MLRRVALVRTTQCNNPEDAILKKITYFNAYVSDHLIDIGARLYDDGF
jgi:hypothetical protein